MNIKKLSLFIICSFLPMIGIGIAMHFTGAIVRYALSAAAMLLPMVAVIITQAMYKEPVLQGLGISFKINRWWIFGWTLIPVITLAIIGVTLLMPGAEWTPDSETIQAILKSLPEGVGVWGIIGITLISGMISGITINAVFSFGEEIAWRGFLIELFKGKKFLIVAIWTGIIWGIWHAPIILNGHNYPQHPVAGVFMMVIFCLLLTPMLMYFRQKSGSVIVPAIMHGTFNAIAGLSLIVVSPVNDLLYGAPGLAGMITLLAADVCLFLYDRYVSKEKIFLTII